MLAKVLYGVKILLVNVFASSTEDECATCHTVIPQGDYYSRIGTFKYCIECRPVKAVSSPSNFRTDRVLNERLQNKHRKVDAATREQLRQIEIEEFRKSVQAREERKTEPIEQIERRSELEIRSEKVCIFKISRFSKERITELDTALIPSYPSPKKHA